MRTTMQKALPKEHRTPERQHDAELPDRRLMEEINILRLEGRVFCFDPREARGRSGTLTATDERVQAAAARLEGAARPTSG